MTTHELELEPARAKRLQGLVDELSKACRAAPGTSTPNAAAELSREIPLNLHLIGASDLPSLAGLSDLPGRAGLYNRIKHSIEGPRSAWMRQAGKLGQRCELAIATVAAEELGLDPALLEKCDSIEHPGGLDWARYSLDPYVLGASPVLFEVKMRSWKAMDSQGWGHPGTAEIAPDVFVQVQAQLAFLRADRDRWVGTSLPDVGLVHVVAAVNGQSLKIYPVPRDEEVGAGLLELGARFWRDHIEGSKPIPVDGSEASAQALSLLFNRPSTDLRPATKGEARMVRAFQRLEARKEKLDRKHALAKQRLCTRIGEDLGLEGDGFRVKWSPRNGRPSHKAIAEVLAKRLDLTPKELKALEEEHRGNGYRWLELKEDSDD